MNIFILVLFLIDFVIHLISTAKHNTRGIFITKPLLMPLLVMYYITSSISSEILIIFALFTGFLGDVFLLNVRNPMHLKLGIFSFMLGHILYISEFIRLARGFTGLSLWHIILLVPYILYGIYIYKVLINKITSLKIEAAVYLTVILSMSFISLLVLITTEVLLFPIFFGSLLFIISDTLLAFNIFVRKTRYGDFMIMFTYVIAQFMIVYGILHIPFLQ